MAEQIIKILNDLGARMGVAIDWTSANILPYLQDLGARIATYVFWSRIIGMCIVAVLMIIAIIVCIVIMKKVDFSIDGYDYNTKQVIAIIFLVFSGIIIGAGVITFPMFAVDAVEAKYLPEKAIYSYIESSTRQARNLNNN